LTNIRSVIQKFGESIPRIPPSRFNSKASRPEVLKQIKDSNIEDCMSQSEFLTWFLALFNYCLRNVSLVCFMLMVFPFEDSIFHDPSTNILFASFKYVGYNWAGDMERMRENPKVQEWWKMTDSFQESFVEGAKSSQEGEPAWWKGIQEVFYTP
jgi:L-rhamnose mutarotase